MIVVKSLIPKKADIDAMNKVWMDELDEYGKFIIKDFEKLVSPWSGAKPSFDLARYMDASGTKLVVRVVGNEEGKDKWKWVVYGTKPHIIRPKSGGVLAFPSVYNAGSKPGSLFTSRASSGGETVFTRSEVHHPGTEAREWDALLAKEHQKPYERWMKNAEPRVVKASGHSLT